MSDTQENSKPFMEALDEVRDAVAEHNSTGDVMETNQFRNVMERRGEMTDRRANGAFSDISLGLQVWKQGVKEEIRELEHLDEAMVVRDQKLAATENALATIMRNVELIGREPMVLSTDPLFQPPPVAPSPLGVKRSRSVLESSQSADDSSSSSFMEHHGVSAVSDDDPTRHERTPTEMAMPTEVKRRRLITESSNDHTLPTASAIPLAMYVDMHERENGTSKSSSSQDSLGSDFWTASGASTCPIRSMENVQTATPQSTPKKGEE